MVHESQQTSLPSTEIECALYREFSYIWSSLLIKEVRTRELSANDVALLSVLIIYTLMIRALIINDWYERPQTVN